MHFLIKALNVFMTAGINVILSWLMTGGIKEVIEYSRFKPNENATFLELQLPDGLQQRVQYICEGDKTNEKVMLIDGNADQTMSDWTGIRNVFNKSRRLCVWDKPGLGYSSHLLSYQYSTLDFWPHIITALKEKEKEFPPPYILIGCVSYS